MTSITYTLKGDIYLPDDLWERLDILNFNTIDEVPAEQDSKPIGRRQYEVLDLMAQGKTNKQISTILAISEATVKYHVGILFRTLRVRNRTACVSTAQSLKLIGPDRIGV